METIPQFLLTQLSEAVVLLVNISFRTVRASVKKVCWFALLIKLNSIKKLEETFIDTITVTVGCRSNI